jgi:cytochrome c oxidase subunit 2
MRLSVVVESPEDFQRWVAGQQAPPYQPQTELEEQGYDLVTQGYCVGCHSFDPQQSPQVIGPDLAHLFSRRVFAGASFDLNEENLRRWLHNPQAMKPGNLMTVKLSDDEVNAVVAYFLAERDAEQAASGAAAPTTPTPTAASSGGQ